MGGKLLCLGNDPPATFFGNIVGGQPRLANRPLQGGVPGLEGLERPVGKHIGIYAPPLDNSRRPSGP